MEEISFFENAFPIHSRKYGICICVKINSTFESKVLNWEKGFVGRMEENWGG